MKVVTTNGALVHAHWPGSKNKPLTAGDAKGLAGAANARAEALGIKTRYRVVA